MRTEKQIAASQANGAKSRGPVTARGKRVSSQNSLRHGMLARALLLPGESVDRFSLLYQSFYDELLPRTSIELALIEKMAVAHWRQMRLWSFEKAHTQAGRGHTNETLLRYEAHCDLQFCRALDDLLKFRETNPAPRSKQGLSTSPGIPEIG
jgi:hypothetical protein